VHDQTDAQLLQAYAERHSEPAFAELVRRHVDLVHSAALRMVGDAHLAQDVSQATFVALAKNATQLTDRPVLAGWLHRTAQNIAAQTVRTDVRRRAREQKAVAMNELLTAEPEVTWEAIAPHLDAALGELNESDHDILLLSYFEGKSARQMAQILGISDEAAQKRASRAVERLREFFAKRGITVGASGLILVITANAVQAAPVGLALTISAAAAIAGTTLATTATITATKAIAMTALQKITVTATIAVLAGVGIYEARQASQLRGQVQTFQQQQAALTEQVQQFRNERDDAFRQLATLREENKRVSANTNMPELLRLRGEVGLLRQATIELNELKQDPRLAFSDDDVTKVQQMHATETMNKLMSAIKRFATIHAGRYPKDFNELKASVDISSTDFQGNLGFDDFVFLAPDTRDFQGTLLILRNRSPIKSPKGDLVWIYGSLKNDIPSTIATTAKYGD